MIENEAELKYGFLGAVIWFLGMLGAAIQFTVSIHFKMDASEFILIAVYFMFFALLFSFPMIYFIRYYLKKRNFKYWHLLALNAVLFAYVGFLSSNIGRVDESYSDRIMYHLFWVILIVLIWNFFWFLEKRESQK